MDSTVIGGIVRQVLTAVAGGLVTNGYIDADQLQQAAGLIVAVGTLAWSIIQKKSAAKKLEVAAQTGVNPTTVQPK